MDSEDDLIPISALQHFLFCPRQCALIHLERIWAENRLTVQGNQLHEKAHHGKNETRPGLRITRALDLRSFVFGLIGKADVVEFHLDAVGELTQPFPVEYKRGKPKAHDADRVQLCAQCLCLEEMLNCDIPAGALFYGTIKRRQDVAFDNQLRSTTQDILHQTRQMFTEQITPPAVHDSKCTNCSLAELCMPELASKKSASKYLNRSFDDLKKQFSQEPDA